MLPTVFTQAGVGYVHAFAHQMGGLYHVPHGLANAIIMPYVLDFSKPACLQRLAELARISSIIRLACGAEIISFGNHEASTLPLISGANTITAELWSNPRKGELERVAGASVAEARRKLWEAGWSLLA